MTRITSQNLIGIVSTKFLIDPEQFRRERERKFARGRELRAELTRSGNGRIQPSGSHRLRFNLKERNHNALEAQHLITKPVLALS